MVFSHSQIQCDALRTRIQGCRPFGFNHAGWTDRLGLFVCVFNTYPIIPLDFYIQSNALFKIYAAYSSPKAELPNDGYTPSSGSIC